MTRLSIRSATDFPSCLTRQLTAKQSMRGRFLGLGLGDRVPDAKTVWLYRDALAQAGKVEELFQLFDHCPAGDCKAICREGVISIDRATSPTASRSWMLPSCRCRATTIRATRTRRSRRAKCPRVGQISPRNGCRRTWMRAGLKSTARATMATKTMWMLDLSRFRAAPSARLSHPSFKSDRAFPAQC
jgi:hypothetical protein